MANVKAQSSNFKVQTKKYFDIYPFDIDLAFEV
jgi:hypothetical protein